MEPTESTQPTQPTQPNNHKDIFETEKKAEYILSLLTRNNVLLHSFAGSGKTVLIAKLAVLLSEKKTRFDITAMTGMAAVNINNGIERAKKETGLDIFVKNATTLHRWGGIGLARETKTELVEKVKSNYGAMKRWQKTSVLIIDEVSMLGAELFDKLDYVAKKIRKNDTPFGGINLLCVGDFYQLPPVKDEWVFESEKWEDMHFTCVTLSIPKRFDDKEYCEMLIRIRNGTFTNEDFRFLKRRTRKRFDPKSAVKPTILFSKRIDVVKYNMDELEKLPGEAVVFSAQDSIVNKKNTPRYGDVRKYVHLLNDNIPEKIALKVGAQVMLKVNLSTEEGYVNGSRGVVTSINANCISVLFMNGQTKIIDLHTWTHEKKNIRIIRKQIPVILAWSLTIHTSIGCTLDCVLCDLGYSVFCFGQAYVCLSRLKNADNLYITSLERKSFIYSKKVERYLNTKKFIDVDRKFLGEDYYRNVFDGVVKRLDHIFGFDNLFETLTI